MKIGQCFMKLRRTKNGAIFGPSCTCISNHEKSSKKIYIVCIVDCFKA